MQSVFSTVPSIIDYGQSICAGFIYDVHSPSSVSTDSDRAALSFTVQVMINAIVLFSYYYILAHPLLYTLL